MKRLIVLAAILFGNVSAQTAHWNEHYIDVPYHHSDAAFRASAAICKRQNPSDPHRPDTPAVKSCMLKHGFKWDTTTLIRDPWDHSNSDWTDFLPSGSSIEPATPPPPVYVPSANSPDCPGIAC